jgi:hypothetical protein
MGSQYLLLTSSKQSELLGSGVSTPGDQQEMIFPHPWTGVAPVTQELLAQVGRLIRSYRRHLAQDIPNLEFLPMDLTHSLDLPPATSTTVHQAQSSKKSFFSFEPPFAESIVDSGDLDTPFSTIVSLAEAYRYAALFQIYRVFPGTRYIRVPVSHSFTANINLSTNPFPFIPAFQSTEPKDFLLSLALHTTSLLESMPPDSGTRCLQPLVLLTAGSLLLFPYDRFDCLSPSTGIKSKETDIARREDSWCRGSRNLVPVCRRSR